MDSKIEAKYRLRARILKTLAHPARLFIIDELSRESRCVNELADMLDLDISTVSKHLSILREASLVEDKKQGQNVYYSLKTPCVMNFFSCVESVIESRAKEDMKSLRCSRL